MGSFFTGVVPGAGLVGAWQQRQYQPLRARTRRRAREQTHGIGLDAAEEGRHGCDTQGRAQRTVGGGTWCRACGAEFRRRGRATRAGSGECWRRARGAQRCRGQHGQRGRARDGVKEQQERSNTKHFGRRAPGRLAARARASSAGPEGEAWGDARDLGGSQGGGGRRDHTLCQPARPSPQPGTKSNRPRGTTVLPPAARQLPIDPNRRR